MELSIRITDESKAELLLQLLREFSFVEILPRAAAPVLNGKNGRVRPLRRRKLSAEQQEFADGLRESLALVDLHLQEKIQLPTLEETLANL